MIKRLTLENFKSFQSQEVVLGPFTLLVGPNAAGKSNVRDAFQLLHAIGRGYSMAECLNGRYDAGRLEWNGIRGGAQEACRRGKLTAGRPSYPRRPKGWPRAGATVDVEMAPGGNPLLSLRYRTTFNTTQGAHIIGEMLQDDELPRDTFNSHPQRGRREKGSTTMKVRCYSTSKGRDPDIALGRERPVLTVLPREPKVGAEVRRSCEKCRQHLNGLRFLDPDPAVMREYARSEQTQLGNRGENLSAAILHLCQKKGNRELLLDWLRELTPQDIDDIDFLETPTNEVLLKVVEPGQRELTVRSLSDGTLRYLSIATALMAAKPDDLFFIDEVENGIHPTRTHLLVQMLEQMTGSGGPQVIATTHSPLVLTYLTPKALESASYCYRSRDTGLTQVSPILGLPHVHDALKAEPLDRLLTTGWMEHVT